MLSSFYKNINVTDGIFKFRIDIYFIEVQWVNMISKKNMNGWMSRLALEKRSVRVHEIVVGMNKIS